MSLSRPSVSSSNSNTTTHVSNVRIPIPTNTTSTTNTTDSICNYNYTTKSIPIAPQPPRFCCTTTTVPIHFTATPVLAAPTVTFKSYLHQLSRRKSTTGVVFSSSSSSPPSPLGGGAVGCGKRSFSTSSVTLPTEMIEKTPALINSISSTSSSSRSSTPSNDIDTPRSRSSAGSLYVSFPSISDEL